MASAKAIGWVHRLIWIYIYIGLIVLVLGIAVHGRSASAGWGLAITGGFLTAVGVVLIWVRSRMHESTIDTPSDPARRQE